MRTSSYTLLNKGVFGIAVVAMAGIIGAVHFAQAATNNSTSGYGISSNQAAAAANTFQTSLNGDDTNFYNQIITDTQQLKSSLTTVPGTDTAQFEASFSTDTNTYNSAVSDAFNTFRNQVTGDANTSVSRDQFIDEFNNAKATYLNAIDAAKNQLADQINQLGGDSNAQAKDQFMDVFNSDRDAYSNALEQAKNTFADTVSNS
jgi:hypothetical protein